MLYLKMAGIPGYGNSWLWEFLAMGIPGYGNWKKVVASQWDKDLAT